MPKHTKSEQMKNKKDGKKDGKKPFGGKKAAPFGKKGGKK